MEAMREMLQRMGFVARGKNWILNGPDGYRVAWVENGVSGFDGVIERKTRPETEFDHGWDLIVEFSVEI